MEKLSFKLDDFEGPLDLILQLISKHKMNIYDIEISSLLEQYMQAIKTFEENQMEIASEFLDMASRLVYIKTVSLLPKHEEEEQELKYELSGQLIELALCKEAASILVNQRRIFIVRDSIEMQYDRTYGISHTAKELYKAYLDSLGKEKRNLPPTTEKFEEILSRPIISVASRMIYVLRMVNKNGTTNFMNFFHTHDAVSKTVATFLAILELIKARRIIVRDSLVIKA